MRRSRRLAALLVVILVTAGYVVSFQLARKSVTGSYYAKAPSGKAYIESTRLFYFSTNDSLNTALYRFFYPLHIWHGVNEDEFEARSSAGKKCKHPVYVRRVEWLRAVGAQGFEAP
jgi:hypothetical protein